MTAQDLARQLGLPLHGDGNRPIAAAAIAEQAGPQHLAFVTGPKFFAAGVTSQAGCLIAPPDYPRGSQTVIESPQPRAHFAQALAILYPPSPLQSGVHPSAAIDPAAQIHPTAEIGAFSSVGANARIGARCRIGVGSVIGSEVTLGADCILHARVSIYWRVTIGARCIIHSGAVIGADGFGFEMAGGAFCKVPQVGAVEIGDDVEIGANTCIDRATLGVTTIGEGTKLDNMVHIAHNCRIGCHVVIAAQTGLAGGVTIGDYAIVGGQVGVGDKARIESKAVIGSGAGILTSKIVRAGEPVWALPRGPCASILRNWPPWLVCQNGAGPSKCWS